MSEWCEGVRVVCEGVRVCVREVIIVSCTYREAMDCITSITLGGGMLINNE